MYIYNSSSPFGEATAHCDDAMAPAPRRRLPTLLVCYNMYATARRTVYVYTQSMCIQCIHIIYRHMYNVT